MSQKSKNSDTLCQSSVEAGMFTKKASKPHPATQSNPYGSKACPRCPSPTLPMYPVWLIQEQTAELFGTAKSTIK